MKNYKIIFYIPLICLFASCGEPVRQVSYVEKRSTPMLASSEDKLSAPNDAIHNSLKAPQGMDLSQQSPDMQEMLNASVAQLNLSWVLPEGWKEEKGSGMRMATFTSLGDNPVTVSLITLSGAAGGLEMNVSRWLRQIGLNEINGEQFKNFLENQGQITSEGGLNGLAIDLSVLQDDADEQTPSIIAVIFKVEGQSVFFKMTGSLASVRKETENFLSLCRSLRYAN